MSNIQQLHDMLSQRKKQAPDTKLTLEETRILFQLVSDKLDLNSTKGELRSHEIVDFIKLKQKLHYDIRNRCK